MASHPRRTELEIYDVSGMFKQAAVSFRASLPLLLTLALLSSVYETAVERSALLSGLSFSAQNSNFSLQFSFDSKQHADRTPYSELKASGFKKPDTGDSLLSKLLAALLYDEDEGDADPKHGFLKAKDPVQEHLKPEPSGDLQDAVIPSHRGLSGDEDGMSSHNTFSAQDDGAMPSDSISSLQDDMMSRHETGNHGSFPQQTKGLEADEYDIRETSHSLKDNSVDDMEINDQMKENSVDDMELNNQMKDNSVDDMEMNDQIRHDSSDTKNNIAKEEQNQYLFDSSDVNDDESDLPRLKIETVSNTSKAPEQETVLDGNELTFFTGKLLGGRGLDQGAMPHGGMTMLLMFLLVATAVTIFLAVIGFQHAAVLGSVAYSVVSTHMGKRANGFQAIKSSLKSSMGRLMWLAILHATLRGLQSLFFMKTLFGSIMEMEQIEQLVLRLSSTPFAFLAPFTDVDATSLGMSIRIGFFVGSDYIFDGVSYCIYVVACWVTIMERNLWGLGAVSRSCNLVKRMEMQAVVIRLIETIVCGRTCRWLLQHVIGQFGAAFIICIVQVYFLVLWFIFYLSARSKHDQPSHFSHRNLEDFLDRFK